MTSKWYPLLNNKLRPSLYSSLHAPENENHGNDETLGFSDI